VAQAKYYQGAYALCSACGARPCCCPVPAAPAAPAPNLRSITRPVSGNAIPFTVWDQLIPQFTLDIHESGILLYLCRRTIGYGLHAGDVVSLGELAAALNISRRQAARALDALERHRLIERTRRYERGRREHAATHIRVTLPPREV